VAASRHHNLARPLAVARHERVEHRLRGLAGGNDVERPGNGQRMGVERAGEQRPRIRRAQRRIDDRAKVSAEPGVTQ
jgi:hypothetical protein